VGWWAFCAVHTKLDREWGLWVVWIGGWMVGGLGMGLVGSVSVFVLVSVWLVCVGLCALRFVWRVARGDCVLARVVRRVV
jgi:hypothetical protein